MILNYWRKPFHENLEEEETSDLELEASGKSISDVLDLLLGVDHGHLEMEAEHLCEEEAYEHHEAAGTGHQFPDTAAELLENHQLAKEN